MTRRRLFMVLCGGALLLAGHLDPIAANVSSVLFTTGSPNGLLGMASRPAGGTNQEIEPADDFTVAAPTTLTGATFVGLMPSGESLAAIQQVTVELYRVFPNDSTNPPSGNVPTRVNSPSDTAFASRDSIAGTATFTASVLNATFTVANTVVNGINRIPNQLTGGEGAMSGQEVLFSVTFSPLLTLLADHYFFVPQVLLSSGTFLWLSAPGPSLAGDLQAWIRNANLTPDWLRVGTDIIGGTNKFNGTFSLLGFVLSADVNGDTLVGPLDAQCVLRDIAALPGTTGCPEPYVHQHADVNGDGQVSPLDAQCILRLVAGLAATAVCPLGP